MNIFLTLQKSEGKFEKGKLVTQPNTFNCNDSSGLFRSHSPKINKKSSKQYYYFPDLEKYYNNKQRPDYSLNQILENSTRTNQQSTIEMKLEDHKIMQDCSRKGHQILRKVSKKFQEMQISKHFAKIEKIAKERRINQKEKIKTKTHSNQFFTTQVPSIGFYNLSSLETFKYKKTQFTVFPKEQIQPKVLSTPIQMPPSHASFQKQKPLSKVNQKSHSGLKLRLKKSEIEELVPKILPRHRSLKLIQNFYETHKRFQLLFNSIKKRH